MRFTHRSWVLPFLVLLIRAAFAQTHPDDNRNLGDVARETREEKRLKAQDAGPHAAHMRELIADMSVNDPEEYAGQMAFYRVNEYFPGDVEKGVYTPVYFPCTRSMDCDYLTRFFSGNKVDMLQKYTVRDDQFYIYIPYIGKQARFVLLFDRRNSYGKLGS